jgi:hypothetical protein
LPIPAIVRWSSSASPIGRVGSSSRSRRRKRPASNSGARMSGPRPASRWSSRMRDSVISSSTGPRSWTTSWSPRRSASQASRGRGRRSSTRQEPVMRRCEWIVRPPSKRSSRCLPSASTPVTARPASRSGQPARARRGCGVAISSGTWPARTGRIRLAA